MSNTKLIVQDLQNQISRIGQHSTNGGERADAIDHCLSAIARLSTEVQDASSFIPAHDQRTYGEAIKALNSKLQEARAASNPKPRFSFKSKSGLLFNAQKNESAISLSDAAEMANEQRLRAPAYVSDTSRESTMPTTPAELMTSTDGAPEMSGPSGNDPTQQPNATTAATGATKYRQPSFSQSTAVEISEHEDIHVVLPTSASHATSSGTVSNVQRSVVDLSQPAADKPFAALYLKDISSSLIVCGHVRGATMLTNIRNSVIVLASRQYRMHDSSNCDIYLLSSSRPIIENCSDIRFAPLPESYMLESHQGVNNQWSNVDDFKWLQSEQSPNWSIMAPGKRIDDKVWRDTVPGGPEIGLSNVLDAVGIERL